MRIALLMATTALALAGCGGRAPQALPSDNGATTGMTDNLSVPPNESIGNGTADASLAGGSPAETFVMQAAASDMYEITAGKMAVEKATDPALKKFGRQMVDAHTATTRELKAAAAIDNVGASPPQAQDSSHAALLDALTNAGGDQFNQLYRQQQIDAHNQTLTVMQGYASTGDKPSLKAFAAATAPKVKSHLDMLTAMR